MERETIQKENKMNPLDQAPSPEILRQLRDSGLHDQVRMLEQKFGINLDEIEKPLAAFITQDPVCNKLKRHVRMLCTHPDSVLIRGETGTGKELIARALHGVREGNFVAINCAGMPDSLIESELFGYAAGAFTGAKGDTKGLVELANKGTLFLDEIGDLPLALQAKLLRMLEQKTIRRVGGKTEEPISARIIAASHFDLQKLVAEGKFRLDLYARLATFELFIPPLRERISDCALIASQLFPGVKIPWDWNKVELTLNVRDLIRHVRRFIVLQESPKLTVQS